MEDLLLARNDDANAVFGTLVAADVGDAGGPAAGSEGERGTHGFGAAGEVGNDFGPGVIVLPGGDTVVKGAELVDDSGIVLVVGDFVEVVTPRVEVWPAGITDFGENVADNRVTGLRGNDEHGAGGPPMEKAGDDWLGRTTDSGDEKAVWVG